MNQKVTALTIETQSYIIYFLLASTISNYNLVTEEYMNPAEPNPKNKRSKVCLFIQIAILLSILMSVFVGLIYYFGAEEPHADIPHALDEIFGTQVHKDLIANLNKKGNQYAILWGKNQTGIFEFLDHYADVRAGSGGLVIVKKMENNIYETALKFIRYTKSYIEQNINLQNEMDKVQWIFQVRNGQLPVDQLQKIKNTRTKDRVIVGVNKKSKVKGYKVVQFPPIDLQVVEKVIATQFEISPKEASILVNYYGTVPQILKHLDEISYTHEKHLGTNFQNLKDLGKTELKTLKTLCSKGVAPLEGNSVALEEIGAVSFDGKVYWEQRVKRLNYELSQLVQCVDVCVSEQIKAKIAQRRQQQSKAQIEGGDQQQQQKRPEVPAAPKKAAKDKKAAKQDTKQQKSKEKNDKSNKNSEKEVKQVNKQAKQVKKQVKKQAPAKEQKKATKSKTAANQQKVESKKGKKNQAKAQKNSTKKKSKNV